MLLDNALVKGEDELVMVSVSDVPGPSAVIFESGSMGVVFPEIDEV